MQRNKIPFTEAENTILQNQTFLPLKQQAIEKVISLMAALREGIDATWHDYSSNWQIPCTPDSVKISRGENYRNLPYVILDYPRKFARDDVFAFRSMFWWGHFFSYTLHLQGHSLTEFRPYLLDTLPYVQENWEAVHLGVGKTPWQYHYGPSNYQLISHLSSGKIAEILKYHEFMKISCWLPVSADQQEVINTGQVYFRQFMDLLFQPR
jgi:hypothetical protein